MNVDRMRSIDFLAGVPLCFLATLLRWILPRGKPQKPRNVLLIELSEMGSAILVDPAMRRLERDLGAELFFVIFEKNAASLRLLGTVAEERVFTIRETGLVPLAIDTFHFLLWARRNRIDTVIDLELFSRFTALLTGYCGAVNRVGFHSFFNEGLYRGGMLTHKVAYNPHIHIAKNFVSLVRALQEDEAETPHTKVVIGDDEIRIARRETTGAEIDEVRAIVTKEAGSDGPYVLVNANAGDMLPQRRWKMERYAELVRLILDRRDDVTVLLTGSPSERERISGLCERIADSRCVNLAGAFVLEQLPALYEISGLMVTNDSGAAHFASVTNMETFVLFGPETPALYIPLGNTTAIYAGLACSPCVSAANHRKTACRNNVCMQEITPVTVFERIAAVLEALDRAGTAV